MRYKSRLCIARGPIHEISPFGTPSYGLHVPFRCDRLRPQLPLLPPLLLLVLLVLVLLPLLLLLVLLVLLLLLL